MSSSSTSTPTLRENSNPNVESDQEPPSVKKGTIKSFFKPCSAADFFSQFDKKPNYKNMKKQTAAAQKLQSKNEQNEEDTEMKSVPPPPTDAKSNSMKIDSQKEKVKKE